MFPFSGQLDLVVAQVIQSLLLTVQTQTMFFEVFFGLSNRSTGNKPVVVEGSLSVSEKSGNPFCIEFDLGIFVKRIDSVLIKPIRNEPFLQGLEMGFIGGCGLGGSNPNGYAQKTNQEDKAVN